MGAKGQRRSVALVMFAVGLVLTALGAAAALTGDSSASPTVSDRSLARFAERIAEANRTGDADVLLADLHPNVRKIYGDDQCRKLFEGSKDEAFAFEVGDVRGPGRWVFVADGLTFDVDWAYELRALRTTETGTNTVDLHFAQFGRDLVWFTDCGDPVEGAAS